MKAGFLKFRFLIFTAFILAALFTIGNIAFGDVIHMNNGDKISGAVTLKDGMVSVKPPYTEKLLIGFKEISRIEVMQTKDTEELAAFDDNLLKSVCAQKIDPAKYPNAGHVYLYKEEKITYNDDNTVTSESRQIFKILKERSLDAANFVRSFRKRDESVTIVNARSISPEGIVSNLRSDAIKYTDRYLDYPLYDKVKIVQFSVPEVKIGSIVDVKLIAKSGKVDCVNPLTFRQYLLAQEPVKYYKFTLEHPKNVKIDHKKYFASDSLIDLKTSTTGENVIVSFEKNDIADYIVEPSMPPFSYFVPGVKMVQKFSLNEIVSELKKRIGAKIMFNDKMKQDLGNIIKDKKTAKDKAMAIYEFLATNIQHADIETSIEDYHPNEIAKIYSEKYASLYDRSVLLYAFLKEAGLSADICFGTDQNSAMFDGELFSIYEFSNILVECEGEYLFASAEYYPYGIIPEEYKDNKYFKIFNFNGKLININRDKFERSYSDEALELNITPDGNTAFKLNEIANGSSDPSFRASFKNMKPIKRKQAFEQTASNIASGGELKNYTLSDVENHFEKQKYLIEFESPNYVSKLGDMYMLIPIPYVGINTRFVSKEDRKFDIFFDNFQLDSISVSIKLPEGYKVKYIPKSIEKSTEHYKISMKLKYDEKNNIVVFTRSNETLKKLVPVAEIKKLKELFEMAGGLKKERLILEKVEGKAK